MTFEKLKPCLAKIATYLTSPFTRYFWLFMAFFLLSCPAEVCGLFRRTSIFSLYTIIAVLELLAKFGFCSYLITVCCSMILQTLKPKAIGKVFTSLCLAIATIVFVIDMVCINIMWLPLTEDYAAALRMTNGDETKEFFETYIHFKMIVSIAVVFIAIVACSWLLKRRKINLNPKFSVISLFALVLVIAAFTVHGIKPFISTPIDKLGMLVLPDTSLSPNLYEYETHPQLVLNGNSSDDEIVLIIGESLCRDKMSLYGYKRKTTPRQDLLKEQGRLLAFENPESNSTSTIEAFKKFMTTYKGESDVDWYRCTNLIEVMKLAGYATSWISNQSANCLFLEKGLTCFPEYCGKQYFSTKGHIVEDGVYLDEWFWPYIKQVQNESVGKQMTSIHLIGQHESFKNRYTPEFAKFKPSDYSEFPENQAETRAHYDNSVLYNDYVIDSIMRSYDGRNAIVLYFSDHALDIYESNPEYAAHGNHQNKVSERAASRIPFEVYITEKYESTHPEVVARLKASVKNRFSIDNLIYTVMDIAGIRFADNDDVAKYSALSK